MIEENVMRVEESRNKLVDSLVISKNYINNFI